MQFITLIMNKAAVFWNKHLTPFFAKVKAKWNE